MPAKRSFSGSSRNVTSSAPPTNLFDLNNDEAAKFWISENAVQLAEYAIEQKISSMSGSHDIVPVILKSMKSYTIKLYSSAIKSGPVSTSTIFIDFLTMLETYDTTVNDDDHSIQQYLVCCITLRNSLPTSFRSSLVRTLAARSLIPTVTSLNSKGGSTFVVDWLKKLNDLSKVTSKILIGLFNDLLDSKSMISRPVCDTAISSLIEFCISTRAQAVVMVWKELWCHITDNPTSAGKKQAILLLEYAMCVSPGLLNVTHSTIPLKQVTGSVNVGSCTLFAMRKISAILSVNQVLNPQTTSNSRSSALPASESSLTANSISLLYCPELLPLILLCHSEDDHTIAAEALQLLALHSNSSIVRWSKISQSQLPAAIWTSVISAFSFCLQGLLTSKGGNKAAHHKILSALNVILDSNPFGRNFLMMCTAKQAMKIIDEEIKELESIGMNEDGGEPTIVEAKRAVEFLHQEQSFVEVLQNSCYSAVLRALLESRRIGFATRTILLIESILMTACCSVDPCVLLEFLKDLPEELHQMMMRVVQARCLHKDCFMEIAEHGLKAMRHSIHAEDTAGTNLSKSVGYLKLSHLSSLIAPAMGQEESLRLVYELLNDLDMIMSQVNESSSCIPHVLESTLLCLSVMRVEWKSDEYLRSQLNMLLLKFATALSSLKMQVLDGSGEAALHCTVWLLFLGRALNTAVINSDHSKKAFYSTSSARMIVDLIFPDMLANKWVMPAAIILAMQLKEPQRLLFESIGFLQDSAFVAGEMHLDVVLHYFNLIAAVVEENSKMVRISARTRVIGTDTRYYPSVGISSLDRDQTLIDNTLAERDQKLGHQKSTAALEHTAPAKYSESLSAVKIEDDCMDSDYMKAANMEDLAIIAERDDLERSVSTGDSFLACFVPLLTKMMTSDVLPEAVRVGALRTLAEYMKCSRSILCEHKSILEAFIESCPRTYVAEAVSDNSTPYYLHELRTEALLVWMENFSAAPLNHATPVKGLLECLRTEKDYSKGAAPMSKANTSKLLSSSESNGWSNFAITVLRCMHCLLKENKLRDPAEYAVAIGIPLAMDAVKSDYKTLAIQLESREILKEIFVLAPKLLNRIVYRLCISTKAALVDTLGTESVNLNSDSTVGTLFDKAIERCQRLRMVHAIFEIGKSDESFKIKLAEIDRALTDEVIRCNSSFAMAALQNIEMTPESAAAIQEASDLGMFNTMDPIIIKQLITRKNNSAIKL